MITGPQHRGEPSCNRRRAPPEAWNSSEQLPSLTADEVLMSYIRVTFPSGPPTVMLQLPVKQPSVSCLRLTPLIKPPPTPQTFQIYSPSVKHNHMLLLFFCGSFFFFFAY